VLDPEKKGDIKNALGAMTLEYEPTMVSFQFRFVNLLIRIL
jgi:hypothetical protein